MTIPSGKPTRSNFSKYGKVVRLPSGKPTSQAKEYKFWSDIADYGIDGETEIGICTVYRQRVRHITGVERHLRTPEILIPIDGPFVLPLLKEGEKNVEAFRFDVGEAVVIEPAVWHGACLPVEKKETSYFVIFRKGTPHEDVEKKSIPRVEIA